MKALDKLNQEIKAGDVVALGARNGNSGTLKIRRVKSVDFVKSLWSDEILPQVRVMDVDEARDVKGSVCNEGNLLVINKVWESL